VASPERAGEEQGARTGKWQPGRSGNPGGRKPGSGQIGKLRAAIEKDVPEILVSLATAAKAGDVGAARLLLERAIPALKPSEEVVRLTLVGESLAEKGHAALAAIADGQIAPSQGATVLTALSTLAKLVETDELVRRIEALEKADGKR
jgi:hypothetical protein